MREKVRDYLIIGLCGLFLAGELGEEFSEYKRYAESGKAYNDAQARVVQPVQSFLGQFHLP
jgi:hypothetical protein